MDRRKKKQIGQLISALSVVGERLEGFMAETGAELDMIPEEFDGVELADELEMILEAAEEALGKLQEASDLLGELM